MARRKRRLSLEELAQLAEATRDSSSKDARDALGAALAKGESFVAAQAASIVRAELLEGFEGALIDALDRFLSRGAKADPGCHAKLAIVEAMDATDVRVHEPFVRAAQHVQKEKAWGPPVDTAAALRSRALLALGRGGFPDLLILAGAGISDPEPPVRRAALAALRAHGDRLGAGLARLKLEMGDEDPLVTSEAMSALLTLAPDHGSPVLARALDSDDASARELAALALGESQRADALDLLLDRLGEAVLASDRATLLVGLGLHRSEPALRVLLTFIDDGAQADAEAALDALAVRRFEPEVLERAGAAARAAGHEARFREAFRLGEV